MFKRGLWSTVHREESKKDMEWTCDGRRGWQGEVVHGVETRIRSSHTVLSAQGSR